MLTQAVKEMDVSWVIPGLKYIPLYGIDNNGLCQCGKPSCITPVDGKPSKSMGKHPRMMNWQQHATSDIEQIKQWMVQYPGCNWGIQTGKPGGISVIDIDITNNGVENIKQWQADNQSLPQTFMVITGSGGYHYYYEYNEALPHGVGVVCDGVDIRNDGGYVVAPPSKSYTGGDYVRSGGIHSSLCKFSMFPTKLVDAFAGNTRRGTGGTLDITEVIKEGGRNDRLASVAGKLLSKGFSPEETLHLALGWNHESCVPPLPEDEVIRTVTSIYNKHSKSEDNQARILLINDVQRILGMCIESIDSGKPIESAVREAAHRLQTVLPDTSSEGQGGNTPSLPSLDELLDNTITEWRLGRNNPNVIYSGFSKLDSCFNGFRRGGVYVIAADSGVGKSTFSVNLAAKFLEQDLSVYIFSFEMPSDLYMRKLLALKTGIPFHVECGFNPMDEQKLAVVRQQAHSWKFKLEGNNDKLPNTLSAVIQRMKENPSDVYIIDYFQLIKYDIDDAWSREKEVANSVREVERVASELRAVVIAPTQVNRQGKARESEELLMAASGYLLIDRDIFDNANEATLHIQKSRWGGAGRRVETSFIGSTGEFKEE